MRDGHEDGTLVKAGENFDVLEFLYAKLGIPVVYTDDTYSDNKQFGTIPPFKLADIRGDQQ